MKELPSREMHMELQINSMTLLPEEQTNNCYYRAARSNRATMLVILIIGFTAGPAVSL